MMTWLQMDSAPRDRPFLAWCPDMVPPGGDPKLGQVICWWEKNLGPKRTGAWWGDADSELYPILWTELPEAPK
jgi:hypothetical protein